jgi:hypothetical protein
MGDMSLLAELSARVSPDGGERRPLSSARKYCGIYREVSNKWPNGSVMLATYYGGRLSAASK